MKARFIVQRHKTVISDWDVSNVTTRLLSKGQYKYYLKTYGLNSSLYSYI